MSFLPLSLVILQGEKLQNPIVHGYFIRACKAYKQKAYKLFFCLATEIAQPFCSNFSLVLEALTVKISL